MPWLISKSSANYLAILSNHFTFYPEYKDGSAGGWRTLLCLTEAIKSALFLISNPRYDLGIQRLGSPPVIPGAQIQTFLPRDQQREFSVFNWISNLSCSAVRTISPSICLALTCALIFVVLPLFSWIASLQMLDYPGRIEWATAAYTK